MNLQSNPQCELLLEKRNVTQLRSETLQQCQRAHDFLHVRRDSRPLCFCKCHVLCQGRPLLPLSAWLIFFVIF